MSTEQPEQQPAVDAGQVAYDEPVSVRRGDLGYALVALEATNALMGAVGVANPAHADAVGEAHARLRQAFDQGGPA